MFFKSRDDLSELMHTMSAEFEEGNKKEFIIRHLKSYDELSFQIVKRYLPKFDKWIKEQSNHKAEVLYKHSGRQSDTSIKSIDKDYDRHITHYNDIVSVYLVWTGELPKV